MSKPNVIIWLDETKSTNEWIRSHIDSLDNLSVVSALSQTQGRGQGDHMWHSEPGKNLTFSILIKEPDIPASGQAEISRWAAESVIRLIEGRGIEAWIKPPNDIWVGEKKICGILIEHSLRANRINNSIIGIGLNVNQTVFPEDLPNPTSMVLEMKGINESHIDLSRLLDEFMKIFSTASWLK